MSEHICDGSCIPWCPLWPGAKQGTPDEVSEATKKEDRGQFCRTGCKTRDHGSYAECLRDGNLQIGNLK